MKIRYGHRSGPPWDCKQDSKTSLVLGAAGTRRRTQVSQDPGRVQDQEALGLLDPQKFMGWDGMVIQGDVGWTLELSHGLMLWTTRECGFQEDCRRRNKVRMGFFLEPRSLSRLLGLQKDPGSLVEGWGWLLGG
jgi:hypothetical protein